MVCMFHIPPKYPSLWATVYNQHFPNPSKPANALEHFLLTTQRYRKMAHDDSLCCGVWKKSHETCHSYCYLICWRKPFAFMSQRLWKLWKLVFFLFFFNIWRSKVAWRHKIKGRNLLLRSSLNLQSPWNSEIICGLEYLDRVYCCAFERCWNYLL